jgi:hypothetical protein
MKLYTEEQVNLAMRLIIEDKATFKQILELLTPIELPSDDIIKEASNGNIDGYNGAMWLKYNYIIKKKS